MVGNLLTIWRCGGPLACVDRSPMDYISRPGCSAGLCELHSAENPTIQLISAQQPQLGKNRLFSSLLSGCKYPSLTSLILHLCSTYYYHLFLLPSKHKSQPTKTNPSKCLSFLSLSMSSSLITQTISMRLMQYPSSKFYKEIINRPVPTIVYFFNPEDGCGPGEEFEILESGEHLSYEHETFFVNVSESPVPNTPSDLPVTILFSQGEQLGTANGGDIPQFFELIEEAESQV